MCVCACVRACVCTVYGGMDTYIYILCIYVIHTRKHTHTYMQTHIAHAYRSSLWMRGGGGFMHTHTHTHTHPFQVLAMDVRHERALVAYPIGLFYACFALISVF
jgi:hypothetical protein